MTILILDQSLTKHAHLQNGYEVNSTATTNQIQRFTPSLLNSRKQKSANYRITSNKIGVKRVRRNEIDG